MTDTRSNMIVKVGTPLRGMQQCAASKHCGLLVILGLLLVGQAVAQTSAPPAPQRGVYPTGSYTFDNIEAINKVSGILSYSIPITSLPLGRGGMTVRVALNYSSALADGYAYSGYDSSHNLVTFGTTQTSSAGGWRIGGFSYGVYQVAAPIQSCSHSAPPFQIGVEMPDGARHVLKLYGQSDPYQNGTYWFNPVSGQNPCTKQTLPNPLTYYSTDGTYLRVALDTSNPSQYPGGAPWTIYFPDGSTVTDRRPAGATAPTQTMSDRNGNKVTITFVDYNNTTLADDFGRSIQISKGVITQQSINGSNLTWTLGPWSPFTVTPACTQNGPQGCGEYAGGGPAYFRIPSSSSTLQYTFGYDAATGALNSVTVPTGATTTYSYGANFASVVGETYLYFNNQVTQKQVTWTDSADGAVRVENWSYGYSSVWYGGDCPGYCTTVTAPDRGVHKTGYVGSGALKGTVARETEPDGSGTEYLYQQNPAFDQGAISAGGVDSANPFVRLAAHTVAQAGSPVSAVVEVRTIDQNGNLTDDKQYNWIPYSQLQHDGNGFLLGFSGASPLRDTSNSYTVQVPSATDGAGPPDNANAYWSPYAPPLLGLVARSVTSGHGPGAITEFSYDAHGNRTQQRNWDSTKAAGQPATLE